MADYYVHARSGDDSAAGTSPATPWQTLTKVNATMGSFSAGDTIHFAEGQAWTGERLVISCSGSSGNLITFRSYTPTLATSDADPIISTPPNIPGQRDCVVITGDYNRVANILAIGAYNNGIYIQSGASYNEVEDLELTDNGWTQLMISGTYNTARRLYVHDATYDITRDGGRGIQITNTNNTVEESVLLRCPSIGAAGRGVGFELMDNCDNTTIRRCWVEDCHDFFELGANSAGITATDILIEYCVSVNNTKMHWIHLDGYWGIGVSNLRIHNCTIIEDGSVSTDEVHGFTRTPTTLEVKVRNCVYHVGSGVELATHDGYEHLDNIYHLTGTGSLGPVTKDASESEDDPEWVDEAGGDYHLRDNSPCIEAATDLSYTEDYDGNAVPYGTYPDIGAFEWTPTSITAAQAIVCATTRVACNTATGTQDITTADLGGLMPSVALFFVTYATIDGTAADGAMLCVGATTGAGERSVLAAGSEHGAAAANTSRRTESDECIQILTPGSTTVDGEADFSAFIENGVRINWGNAPASAYLLTVVLLAGDAIDAYADTFEVAVTKDNTIDVTAPGFEPDVVLFWASGLAGSGSSSSVARFSFGAAVNDGSNTQRALAIQSQDAADPTQLSGQITDNYAFGRVDSSGAFVWAGEIGTFDSSGFTCTTRAGTGEGGVGYLALGFNGQVDVWLGTVTTPTTMGSDAETGIGFVPQLVVAGLTHMAVIDTAYTDGSAGAFGVSVFDGDDEYCVAYADEDAQATTDTQSLSDNTAVNLPEHDGTAGHVVAFTSFDADGWTWNYTATQGTAKLWWALAIEVAPTIGVERGIGRGVMRGVGRGL